jgi:HSP20 family protein
MHMSNLWPSLWSPGKNEIDPFRSIGREMYDMINRMTKQWPSMQSGFDFGGATPALNVAETKESIEVSAELPGIDEKDVNVTVDGNRLVIAGERKHESEQKEKDWHVKETSYGSFRRSVLLPFEPAGDAVQAHFDKGMLHLTIKKPPEVATAKRTIEIKAAPQKPA